MAKSKKVITSTGNKRLYEMGPIDAIKLISYPAPGISMIEGKNVRKPKSTKGL
jgi:hypothetical protein